MYEVFGPMDTEELNACAKGLREEGDDDRIRLLAKENGIPEFFAEGYIESGEEFADPLTAAMGKLDVEAAEYKNNQIPVEPILDFLKAECVNEDFARCVRHRTTDTRGNKLAFRICPPVFWRRRTFQISGNDRLAKKRQTGRCNIKHPPNRQPDKVQDDPPESCQCNADSG